MNWISESGLKYTKEDYVITGWHTDDSPAFSHIEDILVVGEHAFLIVSVHKTFGIDRHFHSFCIDSSTVYQCAVSVSDLQCPGTFRAHEIQSMFYITTRSHIHNAV